MSKMTEFFKDRLFTIEQIEQRGTFTMVKIRAKIDDGEYIGVGFSKANLSEDAYNASRGCSIALGKAKREVYDAVIAYRQQLMRDFISTSLSMILGV